MSTAQNVRTRPARPQSWALWGFIVGVAITLPATLLALLSHAGEALHPYLVPSAELLRPLSDSMASWPGLVNVVIAAMVNGVIYASGAGALGMIMSALKHR